MPPSEPFKINWTAVGVIVVATITICGWFVMHYLARQRDGEAQARAKEREIEAEARARGSAKQNAMDAALACIDRIVLKVSTATQLTGILIDTRPELEGLVFAFASWTSPEGRDRIHAAWKPYAALKERHVHRDSHWTKMDASGVVDVAKMRASMMEPLKKLRDEIENA